MYKLMAEIGSKEKLSIILLEIPEFCEVCTLCICVCVCLYVLACVLCLCMCMCVYMCVIYVCMHVLMMCMYVLFVVNQGWIVDIRHPTLMEDLMVGTFCQFSCDSIL